MSSEEPEMTDKPFQKTPPGRRAPPRVADAPPETPAGRRAFDPAGLERSASYAEERSAAGPKPYTTEAEAAPARAADARKPPPPVDGPHDPPPHPETSGRTPARGGDREV
jgi:hypothetical protein